MTSTTTLEAAATPAAAAPSHEDRPLEAEDLDSAASIILVLARELHCSGKDTEHTIRTAARLARKFGLDAALLLSWDRVELLTSGEGRPTRVDVDEAIPTVVDMSRVSALTAECDALIAGEVPLGGAHVRIAQAAKSGTPSIAVFATAASIGACALAVIFGVVEPTAFLVIAITACLGGIARQVLLRSGRGILVQDVVAGFIAGFGAALVSRAGVVGNISLVALCPCMILIPGPHLLNGAADLIFYRVPLGASRLLFALVAQTAISIGLVLGLAAAGGSLPSGANAASVAFLRDVAAGCVAATCYAVFYAMPVSKLAWPACVGALAHATHWIAQVRFGFGPAPAAMLASLLAGSVLSPVTRRFQLPFAGVGFASVVSMLPGIYLFPMGGDLVAISQSGIVRNSNLIAGAVGNGTTALLVVLCMTLGLVCPKALFDAWRRMPSGSPQRRASGV